MHSDPGLVERLFETLPNGLEHKKMFGGQCWMLNDNICVGVYKGWLIIRVGIDVAENIFKEPHVKPMDITGKPMKGWLMVGQEALGEDASLERYLSYAINFVKTLPPK